MALTTTSTATPQHTYIPPTHGQREAVTLKNIKYFRDIFVLKKKEPSGVCVTSSHLFPTEMCSEVGSEPITLA